MQRFINNPNEVVEDMLSGYVKAHHEVEYSSDNDKVIKLKQLQVGKVGLVSGGGSGHEPAFLGYIGKNMLDSVAIGEVFSSPPASAFLQAFKSANTGNGVACLYGNYAGDNMNVKMAIKMAHDIGIQVECVRATDDISSSCKDTIEKRHGIAGGLNMWKVAGAKAAQGASLKEVIKVAQKAVDQTRSICVGLSACTIPDVGHPNFEVKDNTFEFGIGHHGEAGLYVEPLCSAKEIASKMVKAINEDMKINKEEVSIIVSGLGATPIMELYILYDEIEKQLKDLEVNIYQVQVGNYVTSLDMNGVALTIMKLDQELKELLDYPASCSAFNNL